MPETPEIPKELLLADVAETTPSLSECGALKIAAMEEVAEIAKEDEPMIEVHAPHEAVHSWKDAFIHIAIIVVGLLIAVGLEQTVEWVHHRQEVAKVRVELRAERETNKETFKRETANWRWETAELENNLMVLAYLQQHPGTPDEKLPGTLFWARYNSDSSQAAWDAATSSGVTSLMPREEIAQYERNYDKLKWIHESNLIVWDAMNDAMRYELTDGRLSHLSPAQINEITTLTQIALTKHWLEGVALENTAQEFKDFPASITSDELDQVRHRPSWVEEMQNPAFALTISRIRAAGYGVAASSAAATGKK